MKKVIRMCVLLLALSIPFSSQALNDASRKALRSALEEGDFETIKDTLEQYDDTDEIIEKVDAVLGIKDDLYYSVDDFEGKTWIYYHGGDTQTAITETNVIIPYIYMESGALRCKIGFRADDWLFFDSIKIKLSDDSFMEYEYKRYDVNEDILDNGKIREYVDLSLTDSDLDRLANSDTMTIRFSSSYKNAYKDYKQEDDIADRFKAIQLIKDVYYAVITYIS